MISQLAEGDRRTRVAPRGLARRSAASDLSTRLPELEGHLELWDAGAPGFHRHSRLARRRTRSRIREHPRSAPDPACLIVVRFSAQTVSTEDSEDARPYLRCDARTQHRRTAAAAHLCRSAASARGHMHGFRCPKRLRNSPNSLPGNARAWRVEIAEGLFEIASPLRIGPMPAPLRIHGAGWGTRLVGGAVLHETPRTVDEGDLITGRPCRKRRWIECGGSICTPSQTPKASGPGWRRSPDPCATA